MEPGKLPTAIKEPAQYSDFRHGKRSTDSESRTTSQVYESVQTLYEQRLQEDNKIKEDICEEYNTNITTPIGEQLWMETPSGATRTDINHRDKRNPVFTIIIPALTFVFNAASFIYYGIQIADYYKGSKNGSGDIPELIVRDLIEETNLETY